MNMSDTSTLTMSQVRAWLRNQEIRDVVELVNDLSEGFGMNLMTGEGMYNGMAVAAYGAVPVGLAEEPYGFRVTLTDYDPERKILAIKTLRELTACGLGDALDIIRSLPKVLAELNTRSEVSEMRVKHSPGDAGGFGPYERRSDSGSTTERLRC